MALERLCLQFQYIFLFFYSLLKLLVTLVVLHQLSSWQGIDYLLEKQFILPLFYIYILKITGFEWFGL